MRLGGPCAGFEFTGCAAAFLCGHLFLMSSAFGEQRGCLTVKIQKQALPILKKKSGS